MRDNDVDTEALHEFCAGHRPFTERIYDQLGSGPATTLGDLDE